MSYAKLIKDPLIVAFIAALIGVALSQLVTHLYGIWAHRKKRYSGLRVLLSQLQNHKEQLNGLKDSLGKNRIYGALDPTSVVHFLNGAIVDLQKDEKLITTLYAHLDNIEMIRRALYIIGMRSAGWTTVHKEGQEGLEDSLKTAIADFHAALDLCLNELKAKAGMDERT